MPPRHALPPLSRMYQVVREETGEYFASFLALLQREMRPPYTLVDMADSFLAVHEGLALRQVVVADSVPRNRPGELLVPILLLMTARSARRSMSRRGWP